MTTDEGEVSFKDDESVTKLVVVVILHCINTKTIELYYSHG